MATLQNGDRSAVACNLGKYVGKHAHIYLPAVLFLSILQNYAWAAKRNRDRISEIINYVERNMIELEELAGEDDLGDM